jgi:hypothetical protein
MPDMVSTEGKPHLLFKDVSLYQVGLALLRLDGLFYPRDINELLDIGIQLVIQAAF